MTQTYEQIERVQDAQQTTIDGSADVTISGVSDLKSSIENDARDGRVQSWKCAGCGLSHGHDTDKHQATATDGFDLSESEAQEMDSNSSCHCGVNELGRRGSDFGVSESKASGIARNAPIPDSEARAMDEAYGTLA